MKLWPSRPIARIARSTWRYHEADWADGADGGEEGEEADGDEGVQEGHRVDWADGDKGKKEAQGVKDADEADGGEQAVAENAVRDERETDKDWTGGTEKKEWVKDSQSSWGLKV